MTTDLTLQIPDELASHLSSLASQQNLSLDQFILNVLEQGYPTSSPGEEEKLLGDEDPIAPLIGSLDLGTTDLGDKHDQYISQALLAELDSHD